MGTHPIFESDFDCLTEINREKKIIMDETMDESVDRSDRIFLDFLSSYAASKGLTKGQASVELSTLKPKKLLKKKKRHRKDIKGFLENNVDFLMDEDFSTKYAEMALAINVGEDDDIDKGMEKGAERFAKLTLLEKYIIHRYDELTVANGELEAKYDILAAASAELKNNFKTMKNSSDNEITKLRKENAKLKKATVAEKGSPRKRKAETESIPEGQPSAKEAKLALQQAEKAEKEAAKEAKKAEEQKKSELVKNAPTRPGGTSKAHFASKLKSDNANITLKEVNVMYAKLTDDDKRDLKIEWKKATNNYFTKMKTYLDQLPLEERSHVESKLKLKAT